MKKIITIILLFSIFIFSCSKSTSNSNSINIGLSVSTLNNPFFVALSQGAKDKAKELNVNLIIVNASDDTAKQASDIEDLISKNVQVIIVNPVDSDAAAPAAEDAIAANIPIISLDRAINGVEVNAQISSDNVAGAKIAGEYLIELVGNDAKVAELIGIPGASATIDRGKGFHQAVDNKLNIAAMQTANFNRAEGLTVMENILQANPDIKGVFAHNDEMALGALEAVKAAGKDIAVIGFDATDDALLAIKDGAMKATVAQQPSLMGAMAVETAIKIINSEEVDKYIPVEVSLIKE
ncbi:substrate-binding domain-containing protein [uncultured Brachyspira sp.]|uniref:substrate-binding domain-containing protein n=1 Tax=uncultured Brachyspira sp. TaxID=221953 RepID=UPI00262A064F|nr:substrate-binding domain-containing protein [uncultured Brachyspira sp.]